MRPDPTPNAFRTYPAGQGHAQGHARLPSDLSGAAASGHRASDCPGGEQANAGAGSMLDSAPPISVGRRGAPRLRLSLPAELIAVEKRQTCILLNLSRTGAQVAILDAMRVGEGAILRCGAIDHFAVVTRAEFGLNALEFDEPLPDSTVLEVRRYHENFEQREKRALIETARKWVTGDSDDERFA